MTDVTEAGDGRRELSDAKRRIIEQLKRLEGATAPQLAEQFGLTDTAVRQRNYHRAVEIMEQLLQNPIAKKQFEEYTKKLKDIDAIATPHQP